jgi:hypothetical protein
MATSIPTPQAASRSPAVHPDMAKMLTVVTFLDLQVWIIYNYVTECCQFEDFWSFLIRY